MEKKQSEYRRGKFVSCGQASSLRDNTPNQKTTQHHSNKTSTDLKSQPSSYNKRFSNRKYGKNVTDKTFDQLKPTPGCPISYIDKFLTIINHNEKELNIDSLTICSICCQPMTYIAVGSCRDIICWICSAKMRCLQNNLNCSFCKNHLDYVVIMRNPLLQTCSNEMTLFELDDKHPSSMRSNERLPCTYLTDKDFNPSHYSLNLQDTRYGYLYQSELIRLAVNSLFEFICWNPSCTTQLVSDNNSQCCRFKTLNEWTLHMKTKHLSIPCTICLNGRQIFLVEQFIYSLTDISRHFQYGDRYGDTLIPSHQQCGVCHIQLFDLDGYLQHVKTHHISCYICDQKINDIGTIKPPAFPSFKELNQHYHECHYPCTLCEYVGFKTKEELSIHIAQTHTDGKHELSYIYSSSYERVKTQQRHHPRSTTTYTLALNTPNKVISKQKISSNKQLSSPTNVSTIQTHQSHSNVPTSHSSFYKSTQHVVAEKSNKVIDKEISYPQHSLNSTENDISLQQMSYKQNTNTSVCRPPPGLEPISCVNSSSAINVVYWRIPSYLAKYEDLKRLQQYIRDEHQSETQLKHRQTYQSDYLVGIRQFFLYDDSDIYDEWINQIQTTQNSYFLQHCFEQLWDKQMYYCHNGYIQSRSGREPFQWRSWRYHFPYLTPASDILFLLIMISNQSIQLQHALDQYITTLTISTSSQHVTTHQTNDVSHNNFSNLLNPQTIISQDNSQTLLHHLNRHSHRQTIPHSQRLNSVIISEQNKKNKNNSDGQPQVMNHHNCTFSTKGSEINQYNIHVLLSYKTTLQQANNLSFKNLPKDEKKSNALTTDSLLIDSVNLSTTLTDTDSSTTLPSLQKRQKSLESTKTLLETIQLPIGNQISFLHALQFVLTLYLKEMIHRPQSVYQDKQLDAQVIDTVLAMTTLPSDIVSHFLSSSKNDLSLLNNLMQDAKTYIPSRTIERILSLRATYYLLTKQNPPSSTLSKDWGFRCHIVLNTLHKQELHFLKLYIDTSIELLPQAVLHEEFPQLSHTSSTLPDTSVASAYSSANTTRHHLKSPHRPVSTKKNISIKSQPSSSAPQYSKAIGIQPKMSLGVLHSENHFPSLGNDGEPLKLTSAETWSIRKARHYQSQPDAIPKTTVTPRTDLVTSEFPALPVASYPPNLTQIHNKNKKMPFQNHRFGHVTSRSNQANVEQFSTHSEIQPVTCQHCNFVNIRNQDICQLCQSTIKK